MKDHAIERLVFPTSALVFGRVKGNYREVLDDVRWFSHARSTFSAARWSSPMPEAILALSEYVAVAAYLVWPLAWVREVHSSWQLHKARLSRRLESETSTAWHVSGEGMAQPTYPDGLSNGHRALRVLYIREPREGVLFAVRKSRATRCNAWPNWKILWASTLELLMLLVLGRSAFH